MARAPVQLRKASQDERPRPPPASRGPQTPLPPGGPQRVRVGPLWWIVFGLLMAWNVYSFFPRNTSQVALPYSEFTTQLEQGNVSKVHLVGAAITGTLKQALRWPPAAASAPSAATPAAPASGTAAQPKGASRLNARPGAPATKPADYTSFRTTYPSQIGDPTLMTTLRAQHVTL